MNIKFDRPQGEARLEWHEAPSWPEGGKVCIFLGPGLGRYYGEPCIIDDFLEENIADPTSRARILLAAEKLRNERRRLAEDGSEFRSSKYGYIATFSRPTTEGARVHWSNWQEGDSVFARLDMKMYEPAFMAAFHAYHRTAFLPILPANYCYPPGELPRRMSEDEVRGIHGAALKLELASDGPRRGVRIDGKWWWDEQFAGSDLRFIDDMHPAKVDGQLARLQAFWERSQPKGDAVFPAALLERCALPAGTTDADARRMGLTPLPGLDGVYVGRITNPASAMRPSDATSECPAAVLPEAHSVTLSGEVKAPEEGLEPSWRQAEYDIRGRGTLFISYSKERGGWVIEAMKETDAGHGEVDQDIKEIQFLRAAALSDHIRRGEGNGLPAGYRWMRKRCGHVSDTPQRVCPECGDDDGTTMPIKESAPDLTDLREAWEAWDTSKPDALESFNRLTAAVERLVGK
jgi:hypothetical protein